MKENNGRVLVTGGAGYVGSALVPRLLDSGYQVTVLDLYLYGSNVFGDYHTHPGLIEVKGDLRDQVAVQKALVGCDVVIHLACISNDPSYDLNPNLAKSINYDSFRPLVHASKRAGVTRFVYASSSSVYGIKKEDKVTEELVLEPLTDYSKYKALCEEILQEEREPGFSVITIRPSTVCGYAPRLRLDLSVNILTHHAITKNKITVFGGEQLRPNLHIQDYCRTVELLLAAPSELLANEIFNVGRENFSIMEIAEVVKHVVEENFLSENAIDITTTPSDDMRSYHINSDKIRTILGFSPLFSIQDAVYELCTAFRDGLISDSFESNNYYNVKRLKQLGVK